MKPINLPICFPGKEIATGQNSGSKVWKSKQVGLIWKRGRRYELKQKRRTDLTTWRCWPWKDARGKLQEQTRSSTAKGWSREGQMGVGNQQVKRWGTESGRVLLTNKDKTSVRYWQKFSTWCCRRTLKVTAWMCLSGFLCLSLGILSGKTDRS